MKKKRVIFSLIFAFCLIIFSCSSGDSEGSVSFKLGSALPDKAAGGVSIEELRHDITLSGPTGKQTHTVSGRGTFKTNVTPGLWRIEVEAYYGEDLYAKGVATADVKVGHNTDVTVLMNVVWAGLGTGGGGGGSGVGTTYYTVSFEPNNGDPVFTDTVSAGALVAEPSSPILFDFVIGGWFKDNNTFLQQWSFTSDPVTGNINLYAKWNPCSHTWGSWVFTAPSPATNPGEETRTCLDCYQTQTRTYTGVSVSAPTSFYGSVNGSTHYRSGATFTATVNGTNSPAQSVTWSVSGSGVNIGTDGKITVDTAGHGGSCTITATSSIDTSKSDSVTVRTVTYLPGNYQFYWDYSVTPSLQFVIDSSNVQVYNSGSLQASYSIIGNWIAINTGSPNSTTYPTGYRIPTSAGDLTLYMNSSGDQLIVGSGIGTGAGQIGGSSIWNEH